MSDETDLERDIRVAEAAGRLSPPTLPPGLADRIVRKAISQPQLPEQAVEPAAPARPHARRWLGPAIGGAVAASAFAALLLLWGGPTPGPPQAAPRIAQDTAATPAETVARVEIHGPAVTVPHAQSTPVARPRHAAPALADRRSATRPPPEVQLPAVAAPEAQPVVVVPGPAATEQALVGPPDLDEVGPAMPQRGSGPGMGIAGPPAPVIPGAGSGPPPRGTPRMPSF